MFGAGARTQIMLIAENQRAAFAQHYATNPERVMLLPPGITRDRMAPENAEEVRANMRAELAVSRDQFMLLMVGSSFVNNGVDRSLIALAQLPEDLKRRTRLIVIGQDDARSFVRMAQRLRIGDRFTVLPGRDDIPRFLQAADLLLHPAYVEAGGRVLLEAIVAGLPSIATDVCGYAPFVTRADAGRLVADPFRQDVVQRYGDRRAGGRGAAKRVAAQRHRVRSHRRAYSLPDRAAGASWRLRDRPRRSRNRLTSERTMTDTLYLRDDLAAAWRGDDPFERVARLEGEVFRDVSVRRTLRFEAAGRSYFAKVHLGVGWREILKNLLVLRLPVVDASNEYHACMLLPRFGVSTPAPAAYGIRGRSPATRRSFIVCDELTGPCQPVHVGA